MAWIRGDQRNPAEPEEGYYAVKLVKKGPEVAAYIWSTHIFAGERMWECEINGEHKGGHVDPQLCEAVQQVWLFGRKIDKQEHDFLLSRCAYWKERNPRHPFANPDKPIDLRLMPPIGDD